eukprot:scaffold104602_cov39-Cyclotella_meneghiniana.AAC.1
MPGGSRRNESPYLDVADAIIGREGRCRGCHGVTTRQTLNVTIGRRSVGRSVRRSVEGEERAMRARGGERERATKK